MKFTYTPLILSALMAGPLAASSTALPQFPPPSEADAGGDNVPNPGMHHLKVIVDSQGGFLRSPPVILPKDYILPTAPRPIGWVISTTGLKGIYLADIAKPGGNQAAVDNLTVLATDEDYPESFYFANSDPSGSLDETALDAQGDPIHYNLHYPQETPESFWLEDKGIEGTAPTDDLERLLDEITSSGSKVGIPEAMDILLGTNTSGALTNRAYLGFPLLKYQAARVNNSYDPVTKNLTIRQLWYGNEIVSDCDIAELPAEGEFTITWEVRGLGDIGPNRTRAFPIDEFTSIPMKKASNGDFWHTNSWIWKWFNHVEGATGRRYALDALYSLHTGSESAPSYTDINPADPRDWLHVDRSFDMGSFIGEDDMFDFEAFQEYDLDLNGQIGGYTRGGVDTGAAWDSTTNNKAQFNVYGRNERGVPVINWSKGPFHIPYFGYDSSFSTIRQGQGFDQVIRYGEGEAQAGLYNWGWRQHPPRINWIETYSEGQILASGAPKLWRFAHKWEEIASMGLSAIGDHSPELIIHNALLAYDASAGTPADLVAFEDAIDGMMPHVRDRRGLPPVDDIPGFPEPTSNVNLLYTNLDVYGDVDTLNATGRLNWHEGDTINITIHNDDNFTRYFRAVDFGTTDYQFNGLDMGRFDWKPVYGFPQLAASAWRPNSGTPYGFSAQGLDPSFWAGTGIEDQGNPFFVDAYFEDLSNFWPAHERDLIHQFTDLDGFSGPGFTSQTTDPFSVWANEDLSGLPTSDSSIWSYSYGRPIPANTTVTFAVEMPRASGLNTGALYLFDPQFHASAIYTLHPTSEVQPEGLDD